VKRYISCFIAIKHKIFCKYHQLVFFACFDDLFAENCGKAENCGNDIDGFRTFPPFRINFRNKSQKKRREKLAPFRIWE